MTTRIIAALVACAAVAFIGWLITREFALRDYRSGERAFRRGEPYGAGWNERKQLGWSSAWGEHLRARMGNRG